MLIESKLENISKVAESIIAKLSEDRRFILLNGTLGAGKTTLSKEIGKQLDVQEVMTSPTYTIIKEYKIPKGTFYHIDAYRTNNEDESMDVINDYNENNNVIVIEWSQNINKIIDFSNPIVVDIEIINEDTRRFSIND